MAKKAAKPEQKKAAPLQRKAARAKPPAAKVAKAEASAAKPPAERRHPFGALRDEMNRLFDDFDPWAWPLRRPDFLADAAWPWAREGRMAPAMDLVEHKDGYEISAELPGLTPEDVEIEVTDRSLTIKGEKREETERKEADYHVSERRFGAFRRVLTLPEGVDAESISASVANGVLTVTLPKRAAAKSAAKRVAVKPA